MNDVYMNRQQILGAG